MAIASGIGAVLQSRSTIPGHAFWFGEDQARYVVTTKNTDAVLREAEAAGVPVMRLGATGDGVIAIDGERPLSVEELKRRSEAWLPGFVAGTAA